MTVACPHCGHPSEDWASYCTNCGRPIQTLQKVPVSHPDPRDRNRTKTGLLLMVVGVLVAAVPFVSFVGTILLIVGVLLLFMGADAFGARHRRLVLGSILLYILALVATVVALGALLLQAVLGVTPSTPPEAFEGVWRSALIGLGLGVGALAVPFLLITWELQNAIGRRFLWLALGVDLAGTAALVWYLLPFATVLSAVAGGDMGQLTALLGSPVLLLLSLTSLAWAYPYFLAYRRVAAPFPARPATGL